MANVEVVTHCWNYSRLLCYHLSAFVLAPPKENQVRVSICYCDLDGDTVEVLDYFGNLDVPNVTWNWYPMSKERLCRRAIGRNELARSATADWVFFSDCDYLVSGVAIDAALREIDKAFLCYPRNVLQSKTHEDGDSEIERVVEPGIYHVHPNRYDVIPLDRPIGGCQWLSGDVLREKGYLPDGHKFLNPEPEWRRTYEDARCRGFWQLPWKALELPGVYRIRHSKRGRDEVGTKL